jgi:hypothetical protein
VYGSPLRLRAKRPQARIGFLCSPRPAISDLNSVIGNIYNTRLVILSIRKSARPLSHYVWMGLGWGWGFWFAVMAGLDPAIHENFAASP